MNHQTSFEEKIPIPICTCRITDFKMILSFPTVSTYHWFTSIMDNFPHQSSDNCNCRSLFPNSCWGRSLKSLKWNIRCAWEIVAMAKDHAAHPVSFSSFVHRFSTKLTAPPRFFSHHLLNSNARLFGQHTYCWHLQPGSKLHTWTESVHHACNETKLLFKQHVNSCSSETCQPNGQNPVSWLC